MAHHARRRGSPARDPRAECRALAIRVMKLSVVIPAHNEVESVGATVEAVATRLDQEGIPYEILVIDDASGDGTGDVVREIAQRNPNVRCSRSHNPPGFG